MEAQSLAARLKHTWRGIDKNGEENLFHQMFFPTSLICGVFYAIMQTLLYIIYSK
jgi:hypothetical protein